MKVDPSSERNEDAVLGRRRGLESVKATYECFLLLLFLTVNEYLSQPGRLRLFVAPIGAPASPSPPANPT